MIRGKPNEQQLRVWSDGATQALWDCFECTDWDMFRAAPTYKQCINVDEYTMVVSVSVPHPGEHALSYNH